MKSGDLRAAQDLSGLRFGFQQLSLKLRVNHDGLVLNQKLERLDIT
jgi:hypothetical protein